MNTAINGILYFFGIGPNPLSTNWKNDAAAIRSDWEKVGNDIFNSMRRYEETTAIK